MSDRFEHLAGLVPIELRRALEREVAYLDPELSDEEFHRQTLEKAIVESVAATDASADTLRSEIAGASNDVLTYLATEVGVLNSSITRNVNELREEASSLIQSLDFQSDLQQVSFNLGALLATEIGIVNDRIGKKSNVSTTNATPTVVATVTPSPLGAARLSAKVVGQRTNHYEAAIYSLVAMAKAVPSEETLTVAAGNAANGDQVQIDGRTYTFVSPGPPSSANEVQVGGSNTVTIDNLVAAINSTGTPGTEYGVGTAKHATFSAFRASASTMTVVARLPGTAADGSSVTDPVDGGGTLSWGAATTSGGSDMTLFGSSVTAEYEDDAAWDVTVGVSGGDVEISVTGAASKTIRWEAEVEILEVVTP